MSDRESAEEIIEPELPIIDSHHHLWFMPEALLAAMETQDTIAARALAPNYRRHATYLLPEFSTDLNSGHNVLATVFVDCHSMYRATGPEELKSVGEVEFVNGVAAMAASGVFGGTKACAAIVGGVDLTLGAAVIEIIEAHIAAGGGRYRGVRSPKVVNDADDRILGAGAGVPQVMLDGKFRAGLKQLQPLGLSFDVFLLEPQLPDLIDLARTFPETQMILNHVGAPVGVGRYAGLREERFAGWQSNIRTLSKCANVAVKLGGLGIPFGGFKSYMSTPPATSAQLANEWRPYIETCVEAFGANRCMFESNFPVDAATCSYPVLWNTFKRLTAGSSKDEKAALFSGTAKRVYRMDI